MIELIRNIVCNIRLYKSGIANRNEIRLTAIGWQPDSSYERDMNKTPSGMAEFYKVIRKTTMEEK